MLLINGVIAVIGMFLAMLVYAVRINFDVTGGWLIFVGSIALWIFLFLSDVVEDKLVEMFNKEQTNGYDRPR